jgi:ABC-type spermidine/putrescine transport system permease subunit II
LRIFKKIAHYFARKSFCRKAIDEHADLSAFKEKITMSIVIGIILIALSYAIGLPTVVAFGAIAASMNKPLIGIIGGALIYGISTLMFFIGIKMAGTKYFVALSRWLTRIILEKILGDEANAPYPLPLEESGSEQTKR